MKEKEHIVAVIGPTASGKTSRAIQIAKERDGEIISVDSRQVYRGLDIGTEKASAQEMQGIAHHLIDIREPEETYSAGNFARDAAALITEVTSRGKLPILAGGTHFYFDALLYGLPAGDQNPELRQQLEKRTAGELFSQLEAKDPRRAGRIDQNNKRRLVRALELVEAHGSVPERTVIETPYDVEWVILNPAKEELRPRIDARLEETMAKGLIEEVRIMRERLGDTRLNELGLEYRVIGEYLRGERTEASIVPALKTKLWHYARHQKAWIRTLEARIRGAE